MIDLLRAPSVDPELGQPGWPRMDRLTSVPAERLEVRTTMLAQQASAIWLRAAVGATQQHPDRSSVIVRLLLAGRRPRSSSRIRQLTLEPIQVRRWRAIAPRCAASRGARSRRSRRARGTAARAARVLGPRPAGAAETRRRARSTSPYSRYRWVAAAVGQQPAARYQRTAEAATPPFAPAPRSSRASACDDRRPPRSGAAGRAASATAPRRFADGVGWRVA